MILSQRLRQFEEVEARLKNVHEKIRMRPKHVNLAFEDRKRQVQSEKETLKSEIMKNDVDEVIINRFFMVTVFYGSIVIMLCACN